MGDIDGCERTLHRTQPHKAATQHVSMDPTAVARLSVCVEMLGLDRSASVEAQDHAKVGAVSPQGWFHSNFEPNPPVEQSFDESRLRENARREI